MRPSGAARFGRGPPSPSASLRSPQAARRGTVEATGRLAVLDGPEPHEPRLAHLESAHSACMHNTCILSGCTRHLPPARRRTGFLPNTPMSVLLTHGVDHGGCAQRRVRALAGAGLLPALRRGPVWLTSPGAVDYHRRNPPGRVGRTACTAALHGHSLLLCTTGAAHRAYCRDRCDVPLRYTCPANPRRRWPVDLYATALAANRLVTTTSVEPSLDGLLRLRVLAHGPLPDLSNRERLVLGWCDLTDVTDAAADVALEELWPDSIAVPTLADTVAGAPGIPYTALRGFTD